MTNLLKYIGDKSLKTDDEILKRWVSIGFLEGLNDNEVKLSLALIFEKTTNFLMIKRNRTDFDTLIFPIMRRIVDKILKNDVNGFFKGNEEEINAKKKHLIKNIDYIYILKKLNSLYLSLESIVASINEGNEIDLQAETVREFCEIITPALCRKFKDCDVFIKQNGEFIVFDKK
jgi:hypothetical protein